MQSDQPATAGIGPRLRAVLRSPLLYLLLFVGIANSLTMPRFFYLGDSFAVRAETAYLLTEGELGIPYAERQRLAAFVAHRGQYFFENDRSRRFASKYGFGNTLFYIPPMLAEKWYRGSLDLLHQSESLLLFLNIQNVLLTLIVALYLYKSVSFYTSRSSLRVGFVLACLYCSFVWHYLRAPTLEVFLLFGVSGFTFHMLAFLRSVDDPVPGTRRPWIHLSLATTYAGLMVLMKLFSVLFLVAAWLFALCSRPASLSFSRRLKHNLTRDLRPQLAHLLLPSVIAVALVLSLNQHRFGSALEAGYSQWVTDVGDADWAEPGFRPGRFSPAFLGHAMPEFLFQRGNTNIFLHQPLLLLALVGVPAFWRKHRLDCAFLAFVFSTNLVALFFFASWRGEWCYGPRYLVPVLMVGVLPAVEVAGWLRGSARSAVGIVGLSLLGLILAVSLRLQVCVNSLPFFAYNQIRPAFQAFRDARVVQYWDAPVHRGCIYCDLLAHRNGERILYPLVVLEEILPERSRERLGRVSQVVEEHSKSNYFFFR